MAVKFLSQEWADAMTQAVNSSDVFVAAARGRQARVQQVVAETPEGETRYYFTLENGTALIGLGEVENADATVNQDYDTAVAISKREMHPQQAFMQGKVRISGNLMKLLQLQGVLSAFGDAVSGVDVDYDLGRG